MRASGMIGLGGALALVAALPSCGSGDTGPQASASTGTGAGGSGETTGSGGNRGTGGATTSGTGATSGSGGIAGTCVTLPAGAIYARDHLDSWGVVASPGSKDQVPTLAAELEHIGVRRLRSELALTSVELWQALQDEMKNKKHARPRLKFNSLVTAYNGHPATWDGQKPALLAAAAAGLLTSIEGPNEMNNYSTGMGTHGVNDTTDMTDAWAGPNGNVFAWMSAIHSWKVGLTGADATAMAKVELFAPTIATGEKDKYAMLPDLSALVDYGTVHYYAGGGQQPSLEFGMDNPEVGYFANLYRWCQKGVTPNKPVVVSECGATTPPGDQYGSHAQAAYALNQLHEAAGIGARYTYFYTLVDPSTGQGGVEGNFGLFHTDGSPKPVADALGVVKQLFSLNNSYEDPANEQDTGCFKPGFDPAALTVTGLGPDTFPNRVADAVVYPKSDGSTIISVTNEPKLSDGHGNDITPSPETATVHFGSAQSWKMYDVLGATPTTPVLTGTGDTVDVPLSGYPKYLILDAPPGYHP